MDGKANVLRGDARRLWFLGDATVDLIVTSPPYFGLRDYKDGDNSVAGQIGAEPTPAEFLDALWACAREWHRVLKPAGSLWVNLGDTYGKGVRPKSLAGLPWRYAIGMVDGNGDPDGKGWVLRAEVVWAKPNALPESVRDRVRRSHEQWFHFTKAERYYSAVDTIRTPHASAPKAGAKALAGQQTLRAAGPNSGTYNALGALPGSVWTVANEPLRIPDELGVEHFAAFPTEWPRRIILGWAPTRGVCEQCGEGLRPVANRPRVTQEGRQKLEAGRANARGRAASRVGATTLGPAAPPTTITGWVCSCDDNPDVDITKRTVRRAVVLDPFGGTGTTAAVACALGCHGISVDLSAGYGTLARWRTKGAGYHKVQQRVARLTTDTTVNPPPAT